MTSLNQNIKVLLLYFSVRTALGLYVLGAFSVFGNAIKFRFGPDVKRWLYLITVTQFHFMFYMSRPLPNTFALVLGKLLSSSDFKMQCLF